jgi:hypothetical protein
MTDREEWQTAYHDLLAEGRERVGAPPTVEDVEALFRGDLPEADAERVRELLAYYPEMARVMIEPFPMEPADVLSERDLAQIARIREHVSNISEPAEPVMAFWSSRTFAIAAGVIIAIAIGALVLRPTKEPRAMLTQVLQPAEEHRGASSETPVRLSKSADYTLRPIFSSTHRYREYRLELLDVSTDPERRVWLRDHVARQSDDAYPVILSTEDLEPGLYRLVLYGVNGEPERLAAYPIRLIP